MAKVVKIILLITFTWFYCPHLFAQTPSVGTPGDSDTPEQDLEEITVIGQRELATLKMEVIRAEDLKFEIFNALNSTDDFDITCEMRAQTGTRIKQRFCEVGYIKKAKAECARDFFYYSKSRPVCNDEQLAVEFAAKTAALNKEMTNLAVKHPELATAMIRENELKQRYQSERREKFKNSILIGHPKVKEKVLVINELDALYLVFLDHKKGTITDEIWSNWDKWYRNLFHKESYRTLWASANRVNYAKEFIDYVDAIISEE